MLKKLLSVLLFVLPAVAFAQYPDRVTRIVSPFSPGGGLDIVARRIVMMPDVASRFATLGAEPVATTPEAFAALVRGQMETVKSVAERAKIEVQ